MTHISNNKQPRALVTGATGHIGRTVTHRLVDAGYIVIACGRQPSRLRELQSYAPQAIRPLRFDIRQPSWAAWREVLHSHAMDMDIDLLVCAHGAAPVTTPTIHLIQPQVTEVWETDVLGTLAACRIIGATMVERRLGCICLIASIHARATYPHRLPYVVAKSAVCGMGRALAVEWGQYGVRVNTILPWQVSGGERLKRFVVDAERDGEDLIEAYKQRSPQRRLVEPEDIAETVLWLVRTPSANGMEVVLDGGVTQSMWHKPFLGADDAAVEG